VKKNNDLIANFINRDLDFHLNESKFKKKDIFILILIDKILFYFLNSLKIKRLKKE
jgi:hypothetical protein